MKFLRAALVLAGLGLCSVGPAQPHEGLGVGVIVGEPTGLSLKKWVSDERAYDAAVAWSFSDNASLHLHGDVLQHRYDLVRAAEAPGRVPLYYGLGGRVKLREDNEGRGRNDGDHLVGVRFPVGISYLFVEEPLDVFVEIVPILDVLPDTRFGLNAGIGFRYYF